MLDLLHVYFLPMQLNLILIQINLVFVQFILVLSSIFQSPYPYFPSLIHSFHSLIYLPPLHFNISNILEMVVVNRIPPHISFSPTHISLFGLSTLPPPHSCGTSRRRCLTVSTITCHPNRHLPSTAIDKKSSIFLCIALSKPPSPRSKRGRGRGATLLQFLQNPAIFKKFLQKFLQFPAELRGCRNFYIKSS